MKGYFLGEQTNTWSIIVCLLAVKISHDCVSEIMNLLKSTHDFVLKIIDPNARSMQQRTSGTLKFILIGDVIYILVYCISLFDTCMNCVLDSLRRLRGYANKQRAPRQYRDYSYSTPADRQVPLCIAFETNSPSLGNLNALKAESRGSCVASRLLSAMGERSNSAALTQRAGRLEIGVGGK